jgi:hypothetical protein
MRQGFHVSFQAPFVEVMTDITAKMPWCQGFEETGVRAFIIPHSLPSHSFLATTGAFFISSRGQACLRKKGQLSAGFLTEL